MVLHLTDEWELSERTIIAALAVLVNGQPNYYHKIIWNPVQGELFGGLLDASTSSGDLGEILDRYEGYDHFDIRHELISNVRSGTILDNPVEILEFKELFKQIALESSDMQEIQRDFFYERIIDVNRFLMNDDPVDLPLSKLIFASAYMLDRTTDKIFHNMYKHRATFRAFTREYLNSYRQWTDYYAPEQLSRVNALQDLVDRNCWNLNLPLMINGIKLTINDV